MDKEILFQLYAKIFYLRALESFISKSFIEHKIKFLPESFYKLEALAVSLVSISNKSDYIFSTDRIHPYYVTRYNKIERGFCEYFKILQANENITDNNLRTFYFNDAPERVFNIVNGMASSFKETGFLPAFLITLDSKRTNSAYFLESILFSIEHKLPNVYIIEDTKKADFTILNKLLDNNNNKILKIETKTDDIFQLRSCLHKATRNAREYLMPAVVICDAFNSTDPLEFLENKISSFNFPLDEFKKELNNDLRYIAKENLKEFLNVA